MGDDYVPPTTRPMPVIQVDDSSTLSVIYPGAIAIPASTSDVDLITLSSIIGWAKHKGLPVAFIEKIPRLATRDPLVVREILDELAELGYPFTANDLRACWRRQNPG